VPVESHLDDRYFREGGGIAEKTYAVVRNIFTKEQIDRLLEPLGALPACELDQRFDRRSLLSIWAGFLRGSKYVSYSRIWCLAALIAWCERNPIELGG
jgi:hypothetical protein